MDVAQIKRLAAGEIAEYAREKRYVRKDGSVAWGDVVVRPLKGADGETMAFVAMIADVSERKRATDDLEQSLSAQRAERQRLAGLVDSMDDEVWLVDSQARFTLANPAALRAFGADAAAETAVLDLVARLEVLSADGSPRPPDEAPPLRALKGEIVRNEEEIVRTPGSGELRHRLVTATPLRGQADAVTGCVCVVRDITELKLAEQAMRESEDKFKYVFDHSIVGKSITQLTGEAQINDAFCEMLGYTREELGHTRWQDLTHPDDIAETERQVELLRSGSADSARYEKRYLAKDGSVVWGELSTSVRRDESGESMYLMSTVLDITARKQFERLMAVPSEILGIMAAPSPVRETVEGIVAALKRATGLDAVGLRLEQRGDYPFIGSVGYSGEFLAAENVLSARSPDNELCRNADGSISLECTCGLVISGATDPANPLYTPGGSAWTNDSLHLLDLPPDEDPRLHPRNRCIHVGFRSLALVPLRAGDEILGLLHLGDRHTDRLPREWIPFFEGLGASIGVAIRGKRAEEEIKQLNEQLSYRLVDRIAQLDMANQELESYAYAVSHDVRTPLRAIDGFSATVIEDEGDKLSPGAVDDLRRVRAAAQEMARLMDDLLGFSNATHRDLLRRSVDLSALAAEVAEELAADNATRHVVVSIEPGLVADADATLLRMILRELLGNAWKFTSKHDEAHVEVGVVEAHGELEFYVRDDGAGFDETYTQHLFGLFQRMHPRGEFPGDGVGLATVQRLVRRHGGRIWAEAEVEKGATFYFTLPAEAGPTV